MLATDNWCIKVEDKVYGPYTNDQMTHFATEGRLSLRSLVSPAGGKIWREARQYPPLAALFNDETPKSRSFGKASLGHAKEIAEGETSNFVVIFDVTSGAAGRVENIMRGLGPSYRIADNVWVVSTAQSALGVKNAISPQLDVREPIFVVDCGRGRTSWQNFVPELHAKLTKTYVKAH